MMRIAALAEIHGNIQALEAVLQAIDAERPDLLLISGGSVLDGPEPAAVLDVIRELEEDGAMVVSGLSDLAVADFDLAPLNAAFGSDTKALDDAAQWAHEALGPERVDWLRRLPCERRFWVEDTLVLWTQGARRHIPAGSDRDQGGFGDVPVTDATVVCLAMDHIARMDDRGSKLLVNVGSAGYSLAGDPDASWVLLDFTDARPSATIHRVAYDHWSVARAIEARGLPGDADRSWRFLTGRRR